MTQPEYIEMLRAALSSLAAKCDNLSFTLDNAASTAAANATVAEELLDLSGSALNALATPPPTNKLRPMSEAPEDGKPFLIWSRYFKDPKLAVLISKSPDKWRVTDDTERYTIEWLSEEFKGWLPLPEVEE